MFTHHSKPSGRVGLVNDANNRSIARIEANFEYLNRARQDSIQNASALALQKAQTAKQQTTSNFLMGGLGLTLIFGLLLWSRFWVTKRQKLELDSAYAELNTANESLKELDQLKSRFFANISHELRTPLTIILGMNDQIEKQPNQWLKNGTGMIRKHGKQLLKLINQILDLQKVEAGSLTTNMEQADIISFLQTVTDQYEAFAQSKQQQLVYFQEIGSLFMDYDEEKLLQIVSNLLSNAIKYTPENGQIRLTVSKEKNSPISADRSLMIKVEDTGPGIPEEKLPYIFDRFYRVDSQTGTELGTGIGLSLTQELVKLLNGKIEVRSEVGKGSTFQVFLPITQNAKLKESTTKLDIQSAVLGTGISAPKIPVNTGDLPLALIVEDNVDISQYLKICLEKHYQLAFAFNGQQGIDKALELVPDIIISDVMMPEKDGLELCETLKTDIRTSHIPIVLLTAKSDIDSRLVGLKQGADDYLAKPFHEEELQVRMQNLLEIRRRLQERYQNVYERPLPKAKVVATNVEDAFILKIKEIFEGRMLDPSFDFDALSKTLNLSRSQLGRKIKALTGRSLSRYIRSLRLQKAKQLLLDSELTIKEVAYDVGFTDPAYFSRTYAEEFGESPTDTRVA